MNSTSASPRWWDLPAASLLIVALVAAATRLVVTQWTDHLSIVQTIAFVGALAGMALGQSRFSPRLAGLIALAYGLFFVPWQLGMTMGRGIFWGERLTSLAGRLQIIISQLIKQEVVQDSLLFIVLMSALFWLLSVHAGYTLVRYGRAWHAILPTGMALFAIHSFDSLIARRAWYLAVYLFFSLVLVARVAYLQQHSRWQQSRTALPPHLGLDFIRFTLFAAALLVIFSWTAPALASTLPAAERAFQRIKQPYNEMRDRIDNAFASLRSSVGVVSDYYGSSVLLGRGNQLTDSQVFSVIGPPDIPSGSRLYWRAKVYDTYDGSQWQSTIAASRPFNPQDDLMPFSLEIGRWVGTFEFTTATYISTVFSPPQPLWVSRPAQAEVARNPDDTVDLIAFRATPAITPGQVYQVQASISNVTIADMLAAGTDYPEWIKERYLALPESITPRTHQLALDITAGLDTPYDKVIAITNFLRNNMTYNEVVPNRPNRQDSVDWFLFDIREGFCNYYASAEVVLLRSIGIPARMAFGYAQGERLEDGSYIVRQRDAHAWPEVYFHGLGWIEFEPTASQPVIARLAGDPTTASEFADPSPAEMDERDRFRLEEAELLREQRENRLINQQVGAGTNRTNIFYWGIPIAIAAFLMFFLWRTRDRINLQAFPIVLERSLLRVGVHPPNYLQLWARRAALSPLEKAYLEINNALKRLGSRPNATDTPAERARSLGQIVPDADPPAQKLVTEYQLATFSPQPADISTARQAGSEIRFLSYKTLLQRIITRFQKPPRTSRTWESRRFERK